MISADSFLCVTVLFISLFFRNNEQNKHEILQTKNINYSLLTV